MARPEVTGRRILGDQFSKDKPLVVGVGKAKVLLDCSHDQIYELLKAGDLASYIERNRRKITMASIEALIAKRLAATGGEFQRCSKVPPVPTEKTRRKIAATKKRKAALNNERAAAA
jgi:hypothetical protein